MTPHQFWYDDPDDLWAYWEAYQQKQKEMAELDNIRAFNQGQYILCAIAQCLQTGKKQIFPKKPFPLKDSNEKAKKMTQEEYQKLRKAQVEKMVKRFNRSK